MKSPNHAKFSSHRIVPAVVRPDTKASYVSETLYTLSDTGPRLDRYAEFSPQTLQQLELNKLSEASIARRQARELAEMCIQLLAEATAARWFLEARKRQGGTL